MRRRPDSLRRVGTRLVAFPGLSGCDATLDLNVERPPSQLASNPADSPLKAQLAAHIPAGESGFHLLRDGSAALAARLALAQHARHTLDVQYYPFHNDTTGKLVAAALLAGHTPWIVAHADFVVDPPDKVLDRPGELSSRLLIGQLTDLGLAPHPPRAHCVAVLRSRRRRRGPF